MPYAKDRNEESVAPTNAVRKNAALKSAKTLDNDDDEMIEVPRLEKTSVLETLSNKLRSIKPVESDGGLRNFAGAPHPNLLKIRILEGNWTLFGATADESTNSLSGSETIEWMDGAFFLIRKWESKQNGIKSSGMSIIGHCPFTNTFYATTYDNTGYKRHYKLFVNGNVFTFEGERERIELTVSDDGKFYVEKREISLNKKWMPLVTIHAKKADSIKKL